MRSPFEESRRRHAWLGVEVEASCPFTRGIAAGQIVEIDVQPTLADGLAGNLDPDTITFDIVRREVDEIAVVSEAQLRDAIAGIVTNEELIAEGAGAVGVAAVMAGKLDASRKARRDRALWREHRSRDAEALSFDFE